MKQAAVATAIFAALVSGSAMAATVYDSEGTSLKVGGRLEFRGDFGGADISGKEIEGTMRNKSRMRLNVAGETELNDGLKGFGFWEAEQSVKSSADNDANTTFKQRYMFAGMKGNFGAVSFGRQNTAGVQISDMSDIGTFTGDQKAFINSGNEQINNTFLYAYDLDSFKLKASYIAGEEKDTDGYGLSAIYSAPFGLDVGLGYSANDNGTGSGSANQLIAGLGYSLDAFYIGTTYTKGDIDDKTNEEFDGVEVSAQYKFTKEFRMIAAYQNRQTEVSGTKTDKSDFFELTGRYDFNKNFRSYVAYMLNNLDDDKVGYKVEDTIRLGLRYDF
ncbi:porin [Vibrio fluvialis]|nr:porin [Vibrio fluvialis]